MIKQRIYIVNGKDGSTRLVRASTRHQSVMHVAGSQYEAHVATQDELVDALGNGLSIESYKDVDQTEIEFEAE